MQSLKSLRRLFAIAVIVPGMIGAGGILSAQPPAAEKAEPKKDAPKGKFEGGRFVSFKDGTLILKSHTGAAIERKIAEDTKATVWNHETGAYQDQGAVEALTLTKPGTVVGINMAKDSVTLRIGAKKGQTVGTFVSFKDDRLTILGKGFPESLIKKYGNTVHFQKFDETMPVYESIDGGEYKLVGTPGKVLGNVKEGTVITVHSEGDGNITMVQIGVAKTK